MAKRVYVNRASIRVVFPDGRRESLDTRPDAAIATDTVAFAKWLIRVGEETLEAATTLGQCAEHGASQEPAS